MPDPILGLLSFVGLAVYSVIGGVVGTAVIHVCGDCGYRGRDAYMKGLAGRNGGDADAWIGFGFAAALWPVAVALGAICGVFAGPVWVAHKVGRYVAVAQLKEGV